MAAALEDKCGHCGRDGTMDSVQSVVIDSRSETVATGPAEYLDVEYQTVVEVSLCNQCAQPTFVEYNWVEPLFDAAEDAQNVRRLFPPSRESSDLPGRVSKRYVDMLDMLHAPDAFAVRVGRCLEAICHEEGVPGENSKGRFIDLNQRLDVLVDRGRLPPTLGEQAHLVRKYRNLGGHDGDVEPAREDVPLIRDFVEALLDFLYWGPAKLSRASTELTNRLTAAKTATRPT